MKFVVIFFWKYKKQRHYACVNGGCQPIIRPNFTKNMKMKKITPGRGPSKIFLCRSATASQEGNSSRKTKLSKMSLFSTEGPEATW